MERELRVAGRKMITRRQFFKTAAAGAASMLAGTSFFVRPARGTPRATVTMLHWSHFVPAFNPELERQITAWAAQRGVAARVDFIAVRDIPARLAAEAESRTGHDIVQLILFDPALYYHHLLPLDDIASEVERDSGPWLPVARYVAQFGGRWYALPWYHYSTPATINVKHWRRIGMGAENVAALDWDAFLVYAERLHALGHSVAVTLGQTFDAQEGTHSILYSFGGRVVDAKGNVVIDSAETARAIEYLKRLFRFMPREVLGWDDASNNRYMLSGVGSWVHNGPSIWAVAKLQGLAVADELDHVPMPRGPAGRFRLTRTLCLGIWRFSRQAELAKDLLRFLLRPDNYARQVEASMGYNQPLLRKLGQHPLWRQERVLRYYEPPREEVVVPGWPGPPGPAAQLSYTGFIVPLMFARAATGEMSTSEAIRWAERELRSRYRG